MKKWLSLLLVCLVCLAALPALAEGFVLRQSPYMASQGYADVVLDAQPQRVVCLSSYPFEALYELKVPLVAVASTSTLTYPEEIQSLVIPSVVSGSFDMEQVIALEPDLVFLPDSAMDTHGATLQALGIPVYAVTTKEPGLSTYEVVKQQTLLFIDAFAHDAEAEVAGEAILARFAALEARVEQARARYEGKTFFGATCVSSTDFYLQAQSSTISSMMQMLGFTNVYAESMGSANGPASLETFSDVESDLFVFTTQLKDVDSARALCQESVSANQAVWDTVPAVRRGDVLYLPARYVVTAGLNIIDNIDDLISMLDDHFAQEQE